MDTHLNTHGNRFDCENCGLLLPAPRELGIVSCRCGFRYQRVHTNVWLIDSRENFCRPEPRAHFNPAVLEKVDLEATLRARDAYEGTKKGSDPIPFPKNRTNNGEGRSETLKRSWDLTLFCPPPPQGRMAGNTTTPQ